MESSQERIADGKTLMEILTGAAWWDFNRDAVESDDEGDYIDRLHGMMTFSLKNWNRYFDEDRTRSEEGLTAELAELRKIGYSLVASIIQRKTGPGAPAGGETPFNAFLTIVKD